MAQVVEVPLQFLGITSDTGGADDHAHVLGNVEDVHRPLQFGAVLALDPTRHATRTRRVRHQHHVTAGQRDERGQGSALVAALFLVDLDHDFLAFAQQFAHAGLVVVDALGEVVARDFLQREKPVALGAVVDKGGFERGLEARDLALVDVGLLLFLRRLFDVDVVQGLAVDDGNAQFFRLRRIDEHALHGCVLARFTRDNAGACSLLDTAAAPSRISRRAACCSSASTPRHAAGALVDGSKTIGTGRRRIAGAMRRSGQCLIRRCSDHRATPS